jgi:hypothetical protein
MFDALVEPREDLCAREASCLVLDAWVDIIKADEFRGRGQVTAAQIHDMRRRSFNVGPSHAVPT